MHIAKLFVFKISTRFLWKAKISLFIVLQGVFEVSRDNGIVMLEIAEGFTVDDVKKATGCELKVRPL